MNSGFITQMKDKNGDSWYHQIVVETQQQEIERLKEELKYTVPVVEHNRIITKLIKENERLHSIIKEIREYMKNTMEVDKEYPDYMTLEICEYQELLDILDKENI